MTKQIKDGVDDLRQAARARNRTPQALKLTADDVPWRRPRHIGGSFGNGTANLNDEQLQALAKSLFPFGLFDPETRMLKSANTAPLQSYVTPPSYVPPADYAVQTYQRGPQPVVPPKPQPKKS